MTDFHPACCSALQRSALLTPLPYASCLVSTEFDPALLQPSDFANTGIGAISGVSKRQTEYLAGRLCARSAIAAVSGQALLPTTTAESRAPKWPEGICGSITHGDGLAAAIAAPSQHWQSLGIDIERILPAARAQRLQQQLLTPAELASLEALSPEQKSLRITLSFSLKESLFKALNPLTGRYFYFHDAEIIDWSEDRAQLRLLTDLSTQWPAQSLLEGQFVRLNERVLSLIAIAA